MEATKVTILEDTKMKLQNPALSMKRKRQLRIEAIKAVVRSKPTGQPISNKEMMAAANMSHMTTGAYQSFLNTAIKAGVSTVQRKPHSEYAVYTIIADIVVTRPVSQQLAPPTTAPSLKGEQTLLQYAKDFVFDHDSDSLRAFVKWMDKKELDLRGMADRS